MKTKHQGNLVGHFYRWCDKLPDEFWTHTLAFLGGMIFALVLATFLMMVG